MKTNRFNPFAAVLAVSLATITITHAATKTWDAGGGDLLWNTANNWNSNGTPLAGDTVVFASSFASGTAIDLNGNRTITTLSITSTTDFSLNNNTLTISSGDITRSATSGTTTINSAVSLGGNAAWNIAGNLTANGIISGGAVTLTKSGTGTLTLGAANTYTGLTTITSGTLAYGIDNALSTGGITVNGATAELSIGTYSDTVGTVTLTNGSITGSTGVLTGGSYAVSSGSISAILGGSGALTKSTSGTVTLSGANTRTGSTTVSAGALVLANASALGSGNLNLAGGVLGLGAGDFTRALGTGANQVQLTASSGFAAYSADRTVNIGGGTSLTWNSTANFLATGESLILGNSSADSKLTFQNDINLGTAIRTIQVDDGSADIDGELSGIISSGTGGGISKTGTGSLSITNNNTFTGGLTLTAGTLVLGHNSAAGTGTLTLTAGTVQGLGGTRTITNNLSIGGNLTFSGTENLEFTDSFDQLAARVYTVDNTTTFSGTISGNDNLTKSGTGTLILGGNNTIATVAVNSGGAIRVNNDGALGTTGSGTTVASGGALELIGGRTIGAEALTLDGAGVGGNGALRNISGNNSWAGAITLANVTGVHRINSDSGLLTIGAGGITETGTNNNKDLTFGGAGDITVTGVISSTAAGQDMRLFKDGSGTLILSGTNTYDGSTTLSDGVVSVATIGNGGSSGNLGAAAATASNLVFDGGTLLYTGATASTNRNFTINSGKVATINVSANTLTISGASVSSNGGLTKTGNGTLTLSGNNLHTGDTIINAGTLKLDGSGNVASTNIIVGDTGSSGAVLDVTTKTGGLLVASGKTVSGIGTINGNTTIQSGAFLSPGNSPGVLNNLGNISMELGSNFDIELNGDTPGTGYDQLNVTGSVTLAGLLNVTMGYTPALNTLFFILLNDDTDAIAGTFSNAPVDGNTYTLGGQDFQISYFGDYATSSFTGGNDVVLMAVPEPGAALLGGLGTLLLLRRRRVA